MDPLVEVVVVLEQQVLLVRPLHMVLEEMVLPQD
jgi:hypothetical protein